MTQQSQETKGKEITKVQHKRHPAIVYIVVGIGFLVFFIVCFLAQIQTSEAFITGGGAVDIFRPNWWIFLQVPNLLLGNLSPIEAKAAIWGWGIELMFIGVVVGFDIMEDSIKPSGKILTFVFGAFTVGILIYNFIADFNYGTLGTGFWGQVGFAVMVTFVALFFGVVGTHLVMHGWKKTA